MILFSKCAKNVNSSETKSWANRKNQRETKIEKRAISNDQQGKSNEQWAEKKEQEANGDKHRAKTNNQREKGSKQRAESKEQWATGKTFHSNGACSLVN